MIPQNAGATITDASEAAADHIGSRRKNAIQIEERFIALPQDSFNY